MSITALRTELIKSEYDGMSDAAIATAINAKTVTRNRLTPTSEVKELASKQGFWGVIRIACDASNTDLESRSLAITAIDWIDDVSGKIQNIDFNITETQNLVADLVAKSLLTQTQGNAMLALGQETVQWTETIGWVGSVTSHDIATIKQR